MAKIEKKAKTQQRFTTLAEAPLSGFGAGFITGLGLGDGQDGVSFTLLGPADHDYVVKLPKEEWEALKATLDGMLARVSK